MSFFQEFTYFISLSPFCSFDSDPKLQDILTKLRKKRETLYFAFFARSLMSAFYIMLPAFCCFFSKLNQYEPPLVDTAPHIVNLFSIVLLINSIVCFAVDLTIIKKAISTRAVRDIYFFQCIVTSFAVGHYIF